MLAGWTASPLRLVEDARAEDELAHGAYAGRLLTELAQNAADAAARAGTAGRLRLDLRDGALLAGNTGAPLDAAGVDGLVTLRASAKATTEAAAGRFGVGFAAVLAVTDAPEVRSRTGGVRFSRDASAAALAAAGGPDGPVPVLRLPWPQDAPPEPGSDTTVVLPLRDRAARAAVEAEMAAFDPALLLTLPGLAEVVLVRGGRQRTVRAGERDGLVELDDDGARSRWRVVRRSGRHPAARLADRPAVERARPHWSVLVAAPLGPDGAPAPLPAGTSRVLHAPTATDEPVSLPVLVAGSWPLDSTRRWVAAGPVRDALVEEVAAGYAELAAATATGPAALDLVPVGLAAGELDGRLRAAVLEQLRESAWLPTGDGRRRPAEAVALAAPAEVTEALGGLVADLLPVGWADRRTPLAVLGVRRLGLDDLADLLAGIGRDPGWWRRLYAALAGARPDAAAREALGGLPVPLLDGRTVRGPRSVLILAADLLGPGGVDPAALGLRVVHPGAAHPLLELLGARASDAGALLHDPGVLAAVAASLDAEDPEPVADSVLTLLAGTGTTAEQVPTLAELALPTDDGDWAPAGELVLPGGTLDPLLAADSPLRPVAADVLERFGPAVLGAAGVLDGFAVLRAEEVPLVAGGESHDLDGEAEWLAEVLAGLPAGPVPPVLAELVAVRDLELIDPGRWPQALAALPLPVLTEPAVVTTADGRRREVVPYTRWWLSREPVLTGRAPRDLAVAGSELAGLFEELTGPVPVDPRLLGVRSTLAALLAEPAGAADLLDRLADPAGRLDRDGLRRLYAVLAGAPLPLPERLRAVRDGRVVLADAEDVVVVDAPDLLPLLGDRAVLPVPLRLAGALADTLDVSLASELADFAPPAGGDARDGAVVHGRLAVADADGRTVRVPWRVTGGVVHLDAAATPREQARARAWAQQRWPQRWLLAELAADPAGAPALLAEHDLDEPD